MNRTTKKTLLIAMGLMALTKPQRDLFRRKMKKYGLSEQKGRQELRNILIDVKRSVDKQAHTFGRQIDLLAGGLEQGVKGGTPMRRTMKAKKTSRRTKRR